LFGLEVSTLTAGNEFSSLIIGNPAINLDIRTKITIRVRRIAAMSENRGVWTKDVRIYELQFPIKL
jgi:hypothetical protein